MPVEEWGSAGFVEEARAWTEARAGAQGLRLTGPWQQPHVRPWSSAIRFDSDGGPLWFKVAGPGVRHEPTLLTLLADLVPALAPRPVAVDVTRGWSLTRDAGPTLRSVAAPDAQWDRWEQLLPRLAEQQLVLAGHRDALLATGLPEVSPATLPGQARAVLADLAARDPADGGLEPAQADRLAALLPSYDAWCARLGTSPVPDAVQHDDLHSANVCVAPDGAERVIDWGDAVWGCPLGTMLCTVNSLAFHAGCPVDDPRVLRVRDAYLEPFTGLADRAELTALVTLARRTGTVGRALCYQRSYVGEPHSAQGELDWPVRSWLLEVLEMLEGPPGTDGFAG